MCERGGNLISDNFSPLKIALKQYFLKILSHLKKKKKLFYTEMFFELLFFPSLSREQVENKCTCSARGNRDITLSHPHLREWSLTLFLLSLLYGQLVTVMETVYFISRDTLTKDLSL